MSDSPSLARDKTSMQELIAKFDQHLNDNKDYLRNIHDSLVIGNRPQMPRWATAVLAGMVVVAVLHTGMIVYLVQRLP